MRLLNQMLLALSNESLLSFGKSDQKKAATAITDANTRNVNNTNAGIDSTGARVTDLTGRSDAERANVISGYTGLQGSTAAGIAGDVNSARAVGTGGGSSSGGGGGGAAAPAQPSYLDTFNEIAGKQGGFDPTRLANITGDSTALRQFASTGGVSDADKANIVNPTLSEFSKTGGYSDAQLADMRARSNSSIPAFYQSLKDNLARKSANTFGPGIDRAGFALTRQAAQQTGQQAQTTEANLADAVRSGRLSASQALSQAQLGLSGLTSNNTLQGYQGASNIDTNTQNSITNARLAATTGISQDTLGRLGISSAAGSAQASRDQQAAEFAQSQAQQAQEFGVSGLLNTYQAAPGELMADQNLLRGYTQDQANIGQDNVNNIINASRIPGLGSTISSGLGIAGQIAGIAGGGLSGLSGLVGTGQQGLDPRYLQYGPQQE